MFTGEAHYEFAFGNIFLEEINNVFLQYPQIRYTFVGIFDVDGIFRVNFFLDYRVKRQN